MKELKRCPFCNGKAEIDVHTSSSKLQMKSGFIRCLDCGSRGQVTYSLTGNNDFIDKAIEAWNRRAEE